MNYRKFILLVLISISIIGTIAFTYAVSPQDIVVRRADAAVVLLASINGTSPNSSFGEVTAVSDVNNDGYTDLVVGSSYKNISGGAATDYTGQVSIFYGSAGGFTSKTAAEANVTFNGTYNSVFGSSILVDDFNNDSRKDLFVGAFYKNLSGGKWDFTGQAYIFYGSAEGFHSYSSADANVTINATSPSYFGFPEPTLSDLNNDGLKDLVISAVGKNLSNGALESIGQVYVFYASQDGFHSCTTDNANVTFNGTTPSDFGISVFADDMNNDTYKDLIIGARGKNLSNGARDYTGQAYVFYGSSDGLHSYSVAMANVTYNGSQKEDYFGDTLYAGYINNDSYKDILIAAHSVWADPWETNKNQGMLLIYYGSADGLHSYTRRDANVTINGSYANGNHFGEFLEIADFNGDGYKDILVSSNELNLSFGTHNQMGEIYIFYGNANGFYSTRAADANITINGTGVRNYNFGYSISVSNFNNYSYNGFAIGEPGANLNGGTADKTGRVYIYSLNFPPVCISVPNQSWSEDSTLTLNLSQYFSDVNKDNPDFTFMGNSSIAVSVDEATNVVTLTPTANWYGTEYIVFYANDTFNSLVASNNITLTVSNTADCGDAACDASETCTSCSSDCGVCPLPMGSSGSSIVQSGHTFSLIAADSPLTAEFTGISVNEIGFIATEEISNAKISVKEAELPSSTNAPLGEVNSYIDIDAPKLAGKLKEAKIKFIVEKKWLEENGFAVNEIVLQRLTDNVWRELTTNKVKEDAGKAYYEAVTPGFSLFAITAKKAVKEEVVEEVKEAAEEPAKEEVEAPVTAEKQSYAWIYAIPIAVLIVIAAALSFARVKNHLRKRRHRIYKR